MLVRFATPIHSRTRNWRFSHKPLYLRRTLKMVTTQAVSKRPTCPSCSKPVRLCLCTRIHNPGLHNSVSVTILQHSLEKNHPLNSARIARLGLKNLKVVTVFDVHFDALFVIRLRDPNSQTGLDRNGSKSLSFGQVGESRETQKLVSDEYCDEVSSGRENVGESELGVFANFPTEKSYSSLIDSNELCSFGNHIDDTSNDQNELGGVDSAANCSLVVEQEHEFTSEEFTDAKGVFALETCQKHLDGQCNVVEVSTANTLNSISDEPKVFDIDFDSLEGVQSSTGGPVITATIGKYGVISSLSHTWMPQTNCKNSQFDMILGITEAHDAMAEGFIVQKLQKQPSKESMELDEHVEFEVEVPPGSVLLFPSEKAVSISDLEAMDVKVKNLIVLDGTWAKAKRMYVENPWLKLLPHLRLDSDKLSLYNEVRLQPKPGFLSTIESIVYALKAVGDSPEGLDNLLDVFESMVGDQRRCKEERISNVSPPG